MKIAKPLLLVATPIGLAFGLYEGWRLAGGLVFLMAAMLAVMGVAFGSVVLTIRRERAAQRQRQRDEKMADQGDRSAR
jgi:predicted MFS family arabinose efflux permease